VLVALAAPGCSRFSKEGRSQRAYAKYINQSKASRAKQRAKVQQSQQEIPPAPVSDPVESISTVPEGGPPSDG
jgi:hypothetical protein